MFKIWIDDVRTPPDGTWHWAKSLHEAKIHFIQLGGLQDKLGIISLDHDAGDYERFGGDYYRFLDWLEEKQYIDGIDLDNITFELHTMNPVGRKKMEHIIRHNNWRLEK